MNTNNPSTISEIDAQIAALTKRKEELAREDISNLGVGDYVMCKDISGACHLTLGKVYQIRTNENHYKELEVLNDKKVTLSYFHSRFRPATEAEVDAYLIKEANDKGFVVGAIVSDKREKNFSPIRYIKIYRGNPKETTSAKVEETFLETKKPVIVIGYSYSLALPIEDIILKPKTHPIIITVDNVDYIADFTKNKGCVTFGCAVIDNDTFTKASAFLCTAQIANGNKFIEAIKIGKGLFTPGVIHNIVNRIKETNNVTK